MQRHLVLGVAAALASASLCVACSRERTGDAGSTVTAPQPAASAAQPAAETPPIAAPYPRAAWRLAQPGALAPVVLWVSQIVIRHAQARAEVSFNFAPWFSVAEARRSRAEALALAERVAEQAAQDPARFPEFARQYSEDLPSRDEGGALGSMSAIQMDVWPQVLDALSALRPGQTSRVVETHYGFHVFYRSAPPASERLSGSHIVIGHERAPWLEFFARGQRAQRTREEALALAEDIYRQARAEPERFAELAQRFSEHRDAVAGGDFGDWSSREPTGIPARIERLQELTIGQVGAPIETHLGFEVILRTALRPRVQYRAARLIFPIARDATQVPAPVDAAARAAALEKAEATARRLAQDPTGFDALGPDDMQWEAGRETPELTAALASLQPGQLTAAPVDTEEGFVLARRLEPRLVAPVAFETEFPVPRETELLQFFASLPSAGSVPFLRQFAAQAAPALSLERGAARRLRQLSEQHELARIDATTPQEARSRLLGDWLESTRSLLSSGDYERYLSALAHAAAAQLHATPDAHGPLGL